VSCRRCLKCLGCSGCLRSVRYHCRRCRRDLRCLAEEESSIYRGWSARYELTSEFWKLVLLGPNFRAIFSTFDICTYRRRRRQLSSLSRQPASPGGAPSNSAYILYDVSFVSHGSIPDLLGPEVDILFGAASYISAIVLNCQRLQAPDSLFLDSRS
jgi:hypothetical protein